MQTNHFTYDELTPLEQCIADFMARQEAKTKNRGPQKSVVKKLAMPENA